MASGGGCARKTKGGPAFEYFPSGQERRDGDLRAPSSPSGGEREQSSCFFVYYFTGGLVSVESGSGI